MAAMLNSELNSTDAIAKYTAECRAMGIGLLPPDINESGWYFTVVGDEDPLRPRRRQGGGGGSDRGGARGPPPGRPLPAASPTWPPRSTCAGSTARSSSAWSRPEPSTAWGVDRTALWSSLDDLLDYAQRRRREREEGQHSLFGAMVSAGESMEPTPDLSVRPWPERERLRYEKEALGFFLTGNPLLEYQETLERVVTHTTATLREGAPEGTGHPGRHGLRLQPREDQVAEPTPAASWGASSSRTSKAACPVTLFANQLQQFEHLLVDEAVVLVKGQARERGSEVEITVEEIVPLKKLAGRPLAGVDLRLDPRLSQTQMLKLRDLLTEHPGDVPVTLEMQSRRPDRPHRHAGQPEGAARPRAGGVDRRAAGAGER